MVIPQMAAVHAHQNLAYWLWLAGCVDAAAESVAASHTFPGLLQDAAAQSEC